MAGTTGREIMGSESCSGQDIAFKSQLKSVPIFVLVGLWCDLYICEMLYKCNLSDVPDFAKRALRRTRIKKLWLFLSQVYSKRLVVKINVNIVGIEP